MDKEEMLRRARSGSFSDQNGQVMRAIDLVGDRCKFTRLMIVRHGVYELSDTEFADSIGFLASEEYIELRDTAQHRAADIADFNIDDLEIRHSGKGTRLMKGFLHDDAVKV